MRFIHLENKNSNTCLLSHSNFEEIDSACIKVFSIFFLAMIFNVRHYKLGTVELDLLFLNPRGNRIHSSNWSTGSGVEVSGYQHLIEGLHNIIINNS